MTRYTFGVDKIHPTKHEPLPIGTRVRLPDYGLSYLKDLAGKMATVTTGPTPGTATFVGIRTDDGIEARVFLSKEHIHADKA